MLSKILILILTTFIFSGCTKKSNPIEPSEYTQTKQSGEIISQLISSSCVDVGYVYYATQYDLGSYFKDINYINPYWDVRYVFPNVTTNCIESSLYFNAVLDLTLGVPSVEFGGAQSTLIYKLKDAFAWEHGNNLMMQVTMDEPIYNGVGGGGICFNLFIINIVTNEKLNYVISTHTLGSAWNTEQSDVLYDPTTKTNFVSTLISADTKYTTMSPHSSSTNDIGDNNFYRVNISYGNLAKVVDNPEDWYVSFIGIQSELEESLGDSIVDVSFRGFEAYITDGVM